jgi:PST family polysaccharide transporter
VATGENEPPRDLTSTVVRGVSLAAAGYIGAQILNLGFYVVLARLLEPTDFGEFAAATVLIGFTLLLTDSGMAAAVIQRRTDLEAAASTAAFATFAAGIVFSLLALATAPIVGAFFDSSTVTAIAAASSGTIFLRTAGSVPDALLQRRFSFLRRLIIEPATVIGFGIAAVIAASSDMGPWALVVGQYAGFAIDAILSWVLVRWLPSPRLASFGMWRELVGYGRHVLVATAILHAGEQASTLVVGRALGSASLGQFRYAMRLAAAPFAMLLAGAGYVLFPAFSRIATEAERLRGAFLRSLRWVCVLAFPAGLVFVPLGEPLAVVIFGEVWRPAGEALVAMCLFPIGGMLANVVSEALKAIGEPRLLTRMHAVTSGVMIAAMLALIPAGLTAVSAGMSIGAMAGGVYALFLARGALGIPLARMVAEILPAAAAALVAALILIPVEWVVDASSHSTAGAALLLLAEAGFGAVLYLALLAWVSPPTARQLTRGAARVLRRIARFRGPDPRIPEPEPLDETLAP